MNLTRRTVLSLLAVATVNPGPASQPEVPVERNEGSPTTIPEVRDIQVRDIPMRGRIIKAERRGDLIAVQASLGEWILDFETRETNFHIEAGQLLEISGFFNNNRI